MRRAIERKRDCEGAYYLLAARRSSRPAATRRRSSRSTHALEASGDDYNVYVPITNVFEGARQARGRREQLRQREIAGRWRSTLEDGAGGRRAPASSSPATTPSPGGPPRRGARAAKAVDLRPNDANILYNAACTYGVDGEEARGHRRC